MMDKLIDLITVGVARYQIKQASGEKPDEAALIAEILSENGYCKTSDIFKDIDHMLLMMFEEYASLGHKEYSAVVEVIYRKLKVLEKKYIEGNYESNTKN